MMDYNEFRDNIKKVNSERKHSVNNSLGVYDAYKYIRKNKWLDIERPLKEHEFYSIIRSVNKKLADYLLIGAEIKLPHKLGTIEIRKRPTRLSIVDGKLINTFPIDWDATLKLWYEDKDSYDNRVLVRREDKEVFKICYNVNQAEYTNKTFYQFKPNRELKKSLTKAARNGILAAFNFAHYD